MINLIFGGVSGFQTRLRPRHGVPAIFAASCHPRTWPVVVAACQQAHHPGSDAKLANDRKEPVALANKGLRLRHSYARVTRNRADYLGRIIRETSQIAGDDCRPARPEGLWGVPDVECIRCGWPGQATAPAGNAPRNCECSDWH
jgi:hypothetical protein